MLINFWCCYNSLVDRMLYYFHVNNSIQVTLINSDNLLFTTRLCKFQKITL